MRPVRLLRLSLLLCFAVAQLCSAAFGAEARSLPFLSPVFGDNMVLQRGKPNTLWGWTQPGEHVRVEIHGATAEGVAAADGKWQVQINPPPVGGPYELRITGPESVTLTNLLVGDVWVCSGQSNMQWGLAASKNGEEEIKKANHPNIRLFSVPQQPAYATKSVLGGSWQVCTPETVAKHGSFSAVAYFFATRVQQDVNIPIGLIRSAVGGSPIESWMTPEALAPFPEFRPALEEIARLRAAGTPEYGNFINHWYDQYEVGTKDGADWAAQTHPDADWKPVTLTNGFAELGVPETPSVVWFRREVTLPDPLPAGKARIKLGVVEKMDSTYVNGRWVGASSWVENPRSYPLPDDLLRPGKNLVAIRVLKLKKDGGFQSPAEELRIELGDGTVVPLGGEWRGKLSVDARPPHPLPLGYENYPTMPTVLYQGMIGPLAPLSIAGALWYQGEANFTRAFQYRKLMPAMVNDWRSQFKQGDFPFYMVGLPAFMKRSDTPTEDGWAELREAQALAARQLANVHVAVTIDTGDAEDIHPRDKKPVGERLARIALAKHYGKDVPYSGPRFQRAEKLDGALRLHFAHVTGSLVARGNRLAEFAVAGADRTWHWAEVRLEGNSVVVSSPAVPEPIAARYAWQANPDATLFDSAGLPAHPFRTDDWPLTTEPTPNSDS